MKNKVEVLMHPVRMKICQALMRNKENGLTPLEMVEVIEDVPRATLYRHIQVMVDSGILRVIKEKKVKSVSEKYYALNEEEALLNGEEWKKATGKEKLDYVSYYQVLLMTQYQNYLKKLEEQNRQEDGATFSLVELKIDEEHFINFQNELNTLMNKYYDMALNKNTKDTPVRTIALTIIPDA
ncbi:transcriptional regulator [Priestia endophytica]|uniref:transcriptional regulator n=1 Tax=Priestia endophytica TaxID=135735 RepID=UPI002282C409|nr:transcriptional regulator [Priestia endophytica]MCY8234992.1 transcriptional regulator [Priestia endophytica]